MVDARENSSSPRRPKCVFFDLDCTLTDREESNRRFARRIFVAFGSRLRTPDEQDVFRILSGADRAGYAPRVRVCTALIEGLAWLRPPEVHTLLNFWHASYGPCAVPRAGLGETFELLDRAGIRRGVITNGTGRTQRAKLRALGIHVPGLPTPDVTVISEEVGCKKPDPKIFRTALRLARCAAAEAWFVGDHPTIDVAGARNCGMTAVWLCGTHAWPPGLGLPEHQITRLPELPGLLGLR